MSNHFTQKYGGSAGRILDAWGQDRINAEIGELYEQHVFGQKSINMKELLNEFHGQATGGAVKYSADVKTAPKGGLLEG
jgi:hypothetical protein